MRWLVCTVLVTLMAGGAFADMAKFRETDPRLEKPVTLEVNHMKLEDVAKPLSEQSGVEIKAGTSGRDWKVRERRVTIHAKDIPLGTLLDEIRRLTGFLVSREGKSREWSYIIWQDQKARMLEQEMVTAAKEAQARRATQIRQGMIDAASEALAMTREEALKLREKDPIVAYLGGTKRGRGLAQILSSLNKSFPTEYGLMIRGKSIIIPASDLPGSLDGAVADIMEGRTEGGQEIPPKRFLIAIADGDTSYWTTGVGGIIRFDASRSDPEDEAQLGSICAVILPITSRDDKVGKRMATQLLDAELESEPGRAHKQFDAELRDAEKVADLMARESPTEEDPPTDDPELTREIEILEVPAAFSDPRGVLAPPEDQGRMVKEIARAAGFSVLLESYDKTSHVSAYLKKGKQPFYSILIAAEKAGCAWELGEGTLRIRPKDWAIHRSREISESFLDQYKSLLDRNGAFTLDDLAAITSALTDAQIDGALRDDPDLSYPLMPIFIDGSARKVLRLFGSMTREQKSWLHSENGLGFGYLTDKQWEGVGELITDRLQGIQIADGTMRIPADDEGNYGSSFEFAVLSPDRESPQRFGISMWIPDRDAVAGMSESRKKEQEAAKEETAEAD